MTDRQCCIIVLLRCVPIRPREDTWLASRAAAHGSADAYERRLAVAVRPRLGPAPSAARARSAGHPTPRNALYPAPATAGSRSLPSSTPDGRRERPTAGA